MTPTDPALVEAACRGHDPGLWFPSDDQGDNHGREAKAICAGCPVRRRCLVGALERREEHGIWGGAGGARRRVLRRALGTSSWPGVVAAHWRDLVGGASRGDRLLLGGGVGLATHGNRATYARGCRCEVCGLAAAVGSAGVAVSGPRRARKAAA